MGKAPEYADKDRVRAEFNRMQYANAAKAGAICGASIGAASSYSASCAATEPLTIEQCCRSSRTYRAEFPKGAGNAMLVTGIQHLG